MIEKPIANRQSPIANKNGEAHHVEMDVILDLGEP
jgi:hypothetical protein